MIKTYTDVHGTETNVVEHSTFFEAFEHGEILDASVTHISFEDANGDEMRVTRIFPAGSWTLVRPTPPEIPDVPEG